MKINTHTQGIHAGFVMEFFFQLCPHYIKVPKCQAVNKSLSTLKKLKKLPS